MTETSAVYCSKKSTNLLELCRLGENLCVLVDTTTAIGGDLLGEVFVLGDSVGFLKRSS
jgi:hypothetical protein